MQRRNKIVLAVAIVAAVLIAIRAALPYAVKNYINRTLHGLTAYDGNVDDIDIALWRGAYRVDGIRIVKRGAEKNTPFFEADAIDLSMQWRSLLQGSLVAEVLFTRPVINLIQTASEQQSQTGKEENWQAQLQQLFPFRFDTVEARDATVTFQAPGIRTRDALKAEHVQAIVTNLTNVTNENETTFADFDAAGTVLGSAPVKVSGSLDPWGKQPTFDINFEIKEVAVPQLNPWLRQYIKADAESGRFELFMEIAAAEGKFKGYAKPILQDLQMTSSEEHEENLLRKAWEGIIDFTAGVLTNEKKDQVAARVPFTGTIANPDANVWATIVSVLRNAFVSAFARSIEGSISLRDVKGNLGKYTNDESQDAADKEDRAAREQQKKQDKSEDRRKPAGARGSSR